MVLGVGKHCDNDDGKDKCPDSKGDQDETMDGPLHQGIDAGTASVVGIKGPERRSDQRTIREPRRRMKVTLRLRSTSKASQHLAHR
jgi:hypothetical protein